jgi:hypothetical protein
MVKKAWNRLITPQKIFRPVHYYHGRPNADSRESIFFSSSSFFKGRGFFLTCRVPPQYKMVRRQ